MNSWIHVLARFTPEALLIESLILCLLVAMYLAFWILKKRRFGASQEVVPASVLKTYLNEVIHDAESLRAQLFGLLRQAGVDPGPANVGSGAPQATGVSTDFAAVIASLTSDKQRLEKELADLRAQSLTAAASSAVQPAAAPAGASGAQLASLKEQVASLEARLAEYSVIEDDLANLKRLQQENAKLKAALQSGVGAPEPALPAAAPAPEIAPVAALDTPQDQLADIASGLDALTDADAKADGDPSMEALAAVTGPVGDPTEAVVAPSGPNPAAPKADKSDADLVAEFEKMLNG